MSLAFEKEILELEAQISNLTRRSVGETAGRFDREIKQLHKKLETLKKRVYTNLTPWDIVQVARHPERPTLRDYIGRICSEFIELHGDRAFADDKAIIGGFATIDEHRVMLVGHQKGKGVEENVKVNFGMANPEGYRKALRLMKLAVKYRLPIICFIDTPGAYPGAGAEARGQAEAIASNLTAMSQLQTPIIVIVTGEGGSGGAIGIGVGDIVLMLSNAIYSVISPEGCASILWRDGSKAPEAAKALKLTARSLLQLGVIDAIIPEPPGGAHRDRDKTINTVKSAILKYLPRLRRMPINKLLSRRYNRLLKMGRPTRHQAKIR